MSGVSPFAWAWIRYDLTDMERTQVGRFTASSRVCSILHTYIHMRP